MFMHDVLHAICFEGKKTDCNEASVLKGLLNNIPSIAILNKKRHLTIQLQTLLMVKLCEIFVMNLPLGSATVNQIILCDETNVVDVVITYYN